MGRGWKWELRVDKGVVRVGMWEVGGRGWGGRWDGMVGNWSCGGHAVAVEDAVAVADG